MIGVDELLSLILADIEPLPPKKGLLHDASGRVVVEDIVAIRPLPPFANAAMDGFAVRRADLSAFDGIEIVDEVPAGRASRATFGPGQGVAIATGAPIPADLDTVIPIEWATFLEGRITVHGEIADHGHVRPAGEDVAVGQVVVRRGTVLTDPLLWLAIAAGVTTAVARPRVRVRLLTVGDELVGLGMPTGESQVPNLNNELLMGPVADCGCAAYGSSSLPDDAGTIASSFRESDVDVFVTTGGLGPGARDVVAEAIARAGTVRSLSVAMRPGKAFAFGRVRGRPVYALPGNPGAALAAFHALVAPALRVLAGRPPRPPRISAALTSPVANPGGRRHYVRATLAWDGPTLAATPTGRQGSGLVSDIVAADALLVVPETTERAEAGDVLQVLPLKPIGGA